MRSVPALTAAGKVLIMRAPWVIHCVTGVLRATLLKISKLLKFQMK